LIAAILALSLVGTAVVAGQTSWSDRLPDAMASLLLLPASAATGAVVSSADGELPTGGATNPLPVNVSNVQNLGAATVAVGYDPARVVPVLCRRGPAFSSGLCNLQFDQSGDGVTDVVRFSVISLEGITVAVTSQLPMVSITWQATGLHGLV
jgi:hypothetical protein